MKNPGEFDPTALSVDEVLDLAAAMADRDLQELQVEKRIGSDISGILEPAISLREMQIKRIGLKSLYLMRISDPTRVISPRQALNEVLGDEGLRLHTERFFEGLEGSELTSSETQGFICSLNDNLAKGGFAPESTTEIFTRCFRAAQIVARRHGVTVSEVYRDDNLHSEATREAFTPEQLVDIHLSAIDAMDENGLTNTMLEMVIRDAVPKDKLDSFGPEQIEMLKGLIIMSNPDLRQFIEDTMEKTKEHIRQVALYYLLITWGIAVFDNIPADKLDRIAPRQPYATDLAELIVQ